MGFTTGRSILDNAQLHQGMNYVYNIDLKDFFPSIDQPRVWKCLQLPPFNLGDLAKRGKIVSNRPLAVMIAALCCTELSVERMDADGNWIEEKKNVLPQGAPTSPIL